MDKGLQLPFDRVLATVVTPAKFRDVENRPYQKVGFSVDIQQPDFFDGDDYRSGRKRRVYVDGTKEVADVIAAFDGLKMGERIHLRIVEIGAFGGNGRDDQGRQRQPMVKFTVDHIELPGRPFKNQPVREMAAKAAAKTKPQDATAAAEAKVVAGITK